MELSEKDIEFITQQKTFYKGVIEDNNDPLQMGRVRVRLLGLHSANKLDVPTSTLPWANVIQSLAFGGFSSGIGVSGVPIQGTWVWCFVDFNDTNNVIVLGAISGINSEASTPSYGFNDPSGTYPLADRIGQADINPRVRTNSYLHTYTIETPNHHIIEIDDQNGNITVKHAQGHYINITNTNINLVFNDDNKVTVQDQNVIITSPKTTINGDVQVNGKVNTTGDVVAGTISLQQHTHPDAQGGSVGLPQ
jgi:hypothetical protein